ncbi:hypothetical protein QF035_002738 [Streptomyces umbrinus]|uniref:Uncharacterized protein n=1 Tax=Streptomyces umbrinus TaxID=67370 RepID=A0ABU0SNL8_9ACTN|nr:hypothetical protein [Streptomyces umbrinus]
MREITEIRYTGFQRARACIERRGKVWTFGAAGKGGSQGSSPARRAATAASSRVCAPSLRIAERR